MRSDRGVSNVSFVRPKPPLLQVYSITVVEGVSLITTCLQLWRYSSFSKE